MPGSRNAAKRIGHGVDGDGNRWRTSGLAFEEYGFDRIVIGMEPALEALGFGVVAQLQISANQGAITHFWYQVRLTDLAVAIDDESRRLAEDGRGVEDFR